jgi:PAS domain S-box-containing protein
MGKGEDRLTRPETRRMRAWHQILLACFVFLLCFLTAEIGGALEIYIPQRIWSLWPGCAILVAVLLLVSRRLWPLLIFAGLASFVVYDLRVGLGPSSIVRLILVDLAEILTAALGVRSVFDGKPELNSFKGLAKYCLFAVVLAPVITATLGAGVLRGNYWISWRIIFFSEALAFLTLPPAVLGWADKLRMWRKKRTSNWLEMSALIVGVFVLGYAISVASGRSSIPALSYALVPFLIWSALRFGSLGVSTSIIIVAFWSIWGAIHGRGPFIGSTPLHNVLSLQLFLLFAAIPFMVLAAVAEERRRTQDELIEGEHRLSLAMAAGRLGGWEWEPKAGTNRWFAGTDVVFGIPSRNELGSMRDFWDRVHREDRGPLREAIENARSQRGSFDREFRAVWPDGTVHWLASHVSCIYTSDGEVERMLGLARDVTEQNRAEQALRESEERFRLVADKAPVLIWMAGTDKLCTFVNKGWLDFTGRSMHEELGEGWAASVHPEDLARVLGIYSSAFAARADFQVEYRLRRFDEEYRWILDHGVPRFEANGTFCGYIGSCLDITDRKSQEASLQELSGRLITAQEEERTRIARELHDDLSQRMARLMIRLERCERSMPEISSNSREQLGAVAELAKDVSSSLRGLSHLLHPATLATLGLVTSIGGFCREFSEQHDLRVQFVYKHISKDIPEDVSLCLFRVIQESVRNVLRHSGATEARITLTGYGDRINLSIEDSGIGFDPKKSYEKRATLGLVSMRERVRLVGGQLSIESEPSGGTRIRVQVPLSGIAQQTATI